MIANMGTDMNAPLSQSQPLNVLYAGLADPLVAELRKLEHTRAYRAGSRLITCGEVPQNLMILTAGEAEILLPCPSHAISLGLASPGKVFGLKALMTGESAETDIVCVTSCTLTLLAGSRFLELLRSHPELYFVVAKILSADLQLADRVLKHTSKRFHRASRGAHINHVNTVE